MKRIIILLIFIIGFSSYSSCSKEKITVVDENYIMENYEKTKFYNEKLRKLKDEIVAKYSKESQVNMEDLAATEDYKNFEKKREELSKEINYEIEWAVYVVCTTENLFDKKMFLYGKTNDITEKVLKFLNDEYKRENKLKKLLKKTDIIGVTA